MIIKLPKVSTVRIKVGFAFLPVTAGGYTVWFQLYEVLQTYDSANNKWQNIYFTDQTFSDWTKI